MLQKLDQFILDKFERFSHWTQRTVGITSATWMRVFILLASLFLIKQAFTAGWLLRAGFALMLIIFAIRYSMITKREAGSGREEATANPLKAQPEIRLWGLLIIAVTLPIDLPDFDFWYDLSVVMEYFAACDDLPPSKTKLRQWLESFRSTSELATEAA